MKNKLNPMHTIQEAGSYSDEETASSSSFSSRESIASHQICASSSETETALTGRDTATRRVHGVEKVNFNDGDNADAEEETPHWLSFLFCWGGSPTSSHTNGDDTVLQDKLLEEMLQVDKYNTEQSKNHRILQDYTSSYSTYSMDTQNSSRIDNITNYSNKGSDYYSDNSSSTSSKSSNSSLEEGSSLVTSSSLQYSSSSSSSSSGTTSKRHRELKTATTIGSITTASKATISPSSSNVSKLSKLFSRNAVKSFDSKGKPPLPPRISTTANVTTTFSSEQNVENINALHSATTSASEVLNSSIKSDNNVSPTPATETYEVNPFSTIQHTAQTSWIEHHLGQTEGTSTKKVFKPEVTTDTQTSTLVTESPSGESDAARSRKGASIKISEKIIETGPLASDNSTTNSKFSSLSLTPKVQDNEKSCFLLADKATMIGKHEMRTDAKSSLLVSQGPTRFTKVLDTVELMETVPSIKTGNGQPASEKATYSKFFSYHFISPEMKAEEENYSVLSKGTKVMGKQVVESDTISSTAVGQIPAKLKEETDTMTRKGATTERSSKKSEHGPFESEKSTMSTMISSLFIKPEVKINLKSYPLPSECAEISGNQKVDTDTKPLPFFARCPSKLVEETASNRTAAQKNECCPLAPLISTMSTILSSLFITPEVKKGTAPSLETAKSRECTQLLKDHHILESNSHSSLLERKTNILSEEAASRIFSSSPSEAIVQIDEQPSLAVDEQGISSTRLAEGHNTATYEKSISSFISESTKARSHAPSQYSGKENLQVSKQEKVITSCIMQPNGKGGSLVSESIPRSMTFKEKEMKSAVSSSIIKRRDEKLEGASAPVQPKSISCNMSRIKEWMKRNRAATKSSKSSIIKGDNVVKVSRWMSREESSGSTITHCFIVTKSVGLQKKNNVVSAAVPNKGEWKMIQHSKSNNKENSYLPMKAYKRLRGFVRLGISPSKSCVNKPGTSTSESVKTRSRALSHFSGKESNQVLVSKPDKSIASCIMKPKVKEVVWRLNQCKNPRLLQR